MTRSHRANFGTRSNPYRKALVVPVSESPRKLRLLHSRYSFSLWCEKWLVRFFSVLSSFHSENRVVKDTSTDHPSSFYCFLFVDSVYSHTKSSGKNASCQMVHELWRWREAKVDRRSACLGHRSRCETHEFRRGKS